MLTHKPDSTSLRVLIVEDERRLRALLSEMIPELGFAVSSAGLAEDALAIMEREPHDIVLLDLQLPGMSGMELLEEIRQRWPATQVVILTAFGDLETARRAIHLDVVEFLCKPFHLRDVELAFDRARRRRMQSGPGDEPLLPSIPHQSREHSMTLAEAEYRQIRATLQRHGGNRTAAAEELGISRRTLHYRLVEYKEKGWEVE